METVGPAGWPDGSVHGRSTAPRQMHVDFSGIGTTPLGAVFKGWKTW